MASKLARAQAALRNARERSEEAVAHGVGALVTVGSAGAMAYANARFGDQGRLKVAGIDADLAGGLLFSALGFASMGSAKSGRAEMATMMFHSIGNGLLATYAVEKATELAVEARQRASAAGMAGPRQVAAAQRVPFAGSAYQQASMV